MIERGVGEKVSKRSGVSFWLLGQQLALPLVWVALVVLFGVLLPETFLTAGNWATILGSQAVLVILTLGILFPMMAGDFDLSIAAVLSLSSMIIAVLNVNQGWPLLPCIIIAVVVSAVVGAVNGALIVKLRLGSLVVTLGMATLIQGLVLWVSDSQTIAGISTGLVNAVIVWKVLGIPLAFYYGLALCVVVWYVFDYTPLGRRLLFVGRGRRVSRLSGVRVERLRFSTFVVSGAFAGFAGVVYAGTTGSADPSSGLSYMLPAFAAAFLGATSIKPGRFNPWGSFIAAYFLATGISGLQLLGVESFVQQLFYGAALIIAVSVAAVVRSRSGQEGDIDADAL